MQLSLESFRKSFKYNFFNYVPHPKQLSFHGAGKEAIERLFLAGNRVGKTFCGCEELVYHLTGRYPKWWNGYRFDRAITAWICSESLKDIRSVLQPLLIGENGILSAEDIIHTTFGNNGTFDFITIRNKNGGHSILYSKSYEQGRQKFQGSRVDFIHLDEEPNHDIYTECLLRLSNVDGKGQGRLILTATPLKGMTELMVHFLKSKDSESDDYASLDSEVVKNGKYHIHASWDDNPHLSEETKIHLRRSLQPYELEAREKGLPNIGTGLVYQFTDSDLLTESFEIPQHFTHFCGMDVGYKNPTAVVWCAHDRDNDVIYVYKDYSVSEQTPYFHSASLLAMGLNWIPTLCDPSVNQKEKADGVSLGEHYKKAGLNYINARYSKEEAISEIINRVRTGRFKVFNSCQKFLDERRRYSRGKDGRPVKKDDHIMNAVEFAILDGLKYARVKYQNEYHNYKVMKI